jgi:hypothetical protein
MAFSLPLRRHQRITESLSLLFIQDYDNLQEV